MQGDWKPTAAVFRRLFDAFFDEVWSAAIREKIGSMSDFIPKPGNVKVGGLGPKAARLQAMREKAAQKANGGKQHFDATGAPVKAKTNFAGGKKPNFNRKAV
jgi:hypothetical protein